MLKICGDSICVPLEIIFKQKKEALFQITKRVTNKILKIFHRMEIKNIYERSCFCFHETDPKYICDFVESFESA